MEGTTGRNRSSNPEVAAALRAYELEIRDGTERSQKAAYEELQKIIGATALEKVQRLEEPEPEEQQRLGA
jgi:predicted ATP-binding protein involved in virulence